MTLKEQWRHPAHIQKQKNAERKERERQQHNDHIQIVTALNRISDQLAADEQQESRDHRKRACREWMTIILIFATVTTAGIGDWIFYLTMRDARIASANQHSDSTSVMIADSRAWVGPVDSNFRSPPVKDQEIIGIILYHNTGREPGQNSAHDVVAYIGSVADDNSGKLTSKINQYVTNCLAAPEHVGGEVIYPSTGFSSMTTEFQVPKEDVTQDVIDGKAYIVVQGCFIYRTAGKVRHSAFCYYYRGGKENPTDFQHLNDCPLGNYAN
ncbi:MAG TPA: hypothetical protein VMF53_01010 [Alphaproteobacteria bacterium]|nr:hypothetical protein [Alphaproteobacteria bacterium]